MEGGGIRMNIQEILENYQISILDDKVAFTLLSLILSKGAIDNKNLKSTLQKMNLNFDNQILIKLFKSNLIEKNSDNYWIITTLGKAILSKVGVVQIATIQILVKHIKDENSIEWLKNAIEHEVSLKDILQVYTKFLVADYLMEKNEIHYVDEAIKSNYFYSLFCSSKNDFYILEKDSFYEKYNYLIKENSNVYNKTIDLFDSCKLHLIEFDDLKNKNDIDELFSSMNFSVRTIVYMLNNILDLGLESLQESAYIKSITRLKKKHYKLYNSSLLCRNHFSLAGDMSNNIEEEIKKLLKKELEKNNSIQFLLENKNGK